MVRIILVWHNYEGESFTDKTISLVKSLGVTDEEISSIRKILIK